MFKFKLKDAAQAVEERLYPEVVERIHNEFDSASDELIKQAQEIIGSTLVPNEEKVSRLNKLGFTRTKEVQTYGKKKQALMLSEKQIELVNKYKERYPKNKFITTEQVETICKKYNLVFGDASRYTGFVPEVKLDEIEAFELHEEDKEFIDFSDKQSRRQYESYFSNIRLRTWYPDEPKYMKDLQICAPIKDMDMSGMEVVDGFRLAKHVPDPVVLQAVEGGWIVVAKWGDEASDEILN